MTLELQQKIARIYLKTLGIVVGAVCLLAFCVIPWFVKVPIVLFITLVWALHKVEQ